MAEGLCPERERLRTAVAEATAAMYEASRADREARQNEQRDAIRKLADHVKQHDCD